MAKKTPKKDTKDLKDLKDTKLPDPCDTDLESVCLDFAGYKISVNLDVPAKDCLPIPKKYRVPVFGKLSKDIKDATISLKHRRNTYIHGLPGSGKDALVHALCGLARIPSKIFQILPGVDIQSWFYSRSIDASGTGWQEGDLLRYLRDGYTSPISGRKIPYTLLITDFDRATKHQAEYLRLIMDSIEGRIPGPMGQVYEVYPGTQIVATGNSAGAGDTRGRCISANPIDASVMDRFDRSFEFHWMEWQDEGPIILDKFPMLFEKAPGALVVFGKCVEGIRSAIAQEQIFEEFSHRAVCRWVGAAEDIVMEHGEVPKGLLKRAAKAMLDNMSDPESRQSVSAIIDPILTTGMIDHDGSTLEEGKELFNS